jgi:Domain of unknown function (DUF4124)
MRTLALLLVLIPAFVLAQETAEPAPPPKAPAKDQVYKWVDKDGVIHYGNQPPTEGATPAKLPPIQTFKGGTAPNLNKFAKPGAAPGVAINVDIVTPSREETFRGGERVVPVAVMVTPQMGAGHKLVYVLDGTPASPPTTDTAFALTNVERGSHTVSVTLLGAAGEELANSNPVTFYMHPPTVDQGTKTPAKPPTPPAKPKPKP